MSHDVIRKEPLVAAGQAVKPGSPLPYFDVILAALARGDLPARQDSAPGCDASEHPSTGLPVHLAIGRPARAVARLMRQEGVRGAKRRGKQWLDHERRS